MWVKTAEQGALLGAACLLTAAAAAIADRRRCDLLLLRVLLSCSSSYRTLAKGSYIDEGLFGSTRSRSSSSSPNKQLQDDPAATTQQVGWNAAHP